jgi:cell division protein FtsB
MSVDGAVTLLRQRRWSVSAVFIVGLLVWFFFGGSDGLIAQREMNREIEHLRHDIELISAQNVELRAQITRLQEDLAYLERIARERYGMARPGERVYRVIPTDRTGAKGTRSE